MKPLGMTAGDWYFAFQSQGIAGAPWIGPTVEDTLKALAAAGHKGVVMQPVGFLCDHVEILYDIDVAFTATANELGMQLWRAAEPERFPYVDSRAGPTSRQARSQPRWMRLRCLREGMRRELWGAASRA